MTATTIDANAYIDPDNTDRRVRRGQQRRRTADDPDHAVDGEARGRGRRTCGGHVHSRGLGRGRVRRTRSCRTRTTRADSNIFIPYVAGGDGVVHGDKDLDESKDFTDSDRYSELLTKMLVDKHFPYCLFNTSRQSTTTDDYQDEDRDDGFTQQSKAWDLRPTLITLQVGRENDSIKEHISTCLDQIKDHRFIEANACALAVLADIGAFDEAAATTCRTSSTSTRSRWTATRRWSSRSSATSTPTRGHSTSSPDPRVLRQARRHDPDLPDPLGPAATGAGDPRPDRQAAEQHHQGRRRKVRARVAGPLLLRQPLRQVQGPLHEDGGGDQDEGLPPHQHRRRATTPRTTSAAATRGSRADGDDGDAAAVALPAASSERRPRPRRAEDERHGRLPQQGRAQVPGRADLRGRQRLGSAEVEARHRPIPSEGRRSIPVRSAPSARSTVFRHLLRLVVVLALSAVLRGGRRRGRHAATPAREP